MADPRLIIIGAGPAGVRAAETLVDAGLRPIVVDEGARDGGQIYRRQPEGFTRPKSALYGSETARAQALHATFDRLKGRIDYRPRHLAWNIANGRVHLVSDGATDRLMPVKGWDYAGTYSLGAAQIALKAQAASIGRRVVFMGTGPLLQLVTSQYVQAGANVVALLDTTPFLTQVKALPRLIARPGVLLRGMKLVAGLKRSGIAIHRGVAPLEIHGDAETGVSGVSVRLDSGEIRRFDCDAVGLGYHLRPETQLADLARCGFEFDAKTRQFWPTVDIDGRSTTKGVYLAGDGVRTQISGQLAAFAALADLGLRVPEPRVSALRVAGKRMERFREGIAEAFPWPNFLAKTIPDETIVCRCEGITARELRGVALEKSAHELNRAKAFSRVGMGRCQGRYCGHAAAEIISAAVGAPLETIGRLRGQAPVKPLAISTRSVLT